MKANGIWKMNCYIFLCQLINDHQFHRLIRITFDALIKVKVWVLNWILCQMIFSGTMNASIQSRWASKCIYIVRMRSKRLLVGHLKWKLGKKSLYPFHQMSSPRQMIFASTAQRWDNVSSIQSVSWNSSKFIPKATVNTSVWRISHEKNVVIIDSNEWLFSHIFFDFLWNFFSGCVKFVMPRKLNWMKNVFIRQNFHQIEIYFFNFIDQKTNMFN